MSRGTRELPDDCGSACIALSIGTIGLALRPLVAEKSSFELCQNRRKLLSAKFKVEYFENETEIQKSGPMEFRYCPIDS